MATKKFGALKLLNITQQFLNGFPQEPFVGGKYSIVVAHSTDNPQDTTQGEANYFSNNYNAVQAAVHFFCGNTIIQQLSLLYRGWGAGHTANSMAIHVELVEGENFAASYGDYIALLAALLYDGGLHVEDGVTLMSHKQVSDKWKETDHQDPIAFLASHGKTWSDVVRDVTNKWNEYKKLDLASQQPPKPTVVVAYRVFDNGKQVSSFSYPQNAKSAADELEAKNPTHTIEVRLSTTGAVYYTPKKPTPAPAPQPVQPKPVVQVAPPKVEAKPVQAVPQPTTPVSQPQTIKVTANVKDVEQAINDGEQAVTLLQKFINFLKTLFHLK